MKFLTREQILSSQDLETEEVDAFGGKVLVKSLTAAEREELRKDMGTDEKEMDLLLIQMKLVSLCIVGENRKRLFSEEDIGVLAKKSAKELDKVFEVAQRLSGLGKQGTEEIEKN